jgi:hypothetical protein
MTDANPWLAAPPPSAAAKGDEHTLERPGAAVNVAWQTRAAPPSAYEHALADALQAIFADGIDDLPGIVARLNRTSLAPAAGGPWTEASFVAEMARLGRAGAEMARLGRAGAEMARLGRAGAEMARRGR